MKTANKIILVFVLFLALFIIFYPIDDLPDIKGSWSVNKIIVKGEEKIFTNQINIHDNELYTNEFYLSGNVKYKYKVVKDSFFIFSPTVIIKDHSGYNDQVNDYRFFEGRYKMEIITKILQRGRVQLYDSHLKLINKDKTIVLERMIPVQWPAPIRRGIP